MYRGIQRYQYTCVCHDIQGKDESEFNTVKLRTYCNDMYSAYRGIQEYKPHPRFVLHVFAIHICPHFQWVDAKIVLTLIYLCTLFHTPFIRLSSLWMPGHAGVNMNHLLDRVHTTYIKICIFAFEVIIIVDFRSSI